MGIEIERKFLLKNDSWMEHISASTDFKQGYLVSGEMQSNKASVRIRIEAGKANINIKSMTLSISRQEYEYAIPIDDATQLLNDLCDQPLVEKTRHIVIHEGYKWEIDVFSGENKGLVVAEIELNSENEKFSIPDWLGEEVSDQVKYYNVNLIKNPYSSWR